MATPDELLAEIADVGADRCGGGYSRHAFETAERELRAWFAAQARSRGMSVTTDRNTNIWAWLTEPGDNAVVTGSHLDSAPGGGAFDGALGVAGALAAVDVLRAEQLRPRRPIALVVFTEEQGGRFGVPCLGSRLLTGALPADHASKLRDADGTAFTAALEDFGADPGGIGRDEDALRRIGHFVELHLEQGRVLAELDRPVGVASSIAAHGRWRFRFRGKGNHAGATRMDERCDPMLPASRLVSAARRAASRVDDGRATVGRLVPTPGGANVIPSSVDVWVDARGAADRDARGIVRELSYLAGDFADAEGTTVEVSEESYEDARTFDVDFRSRLSTVLDQAPLVPSSAGHDAGVLAAEKPAGMLFVRNPTGIGHAPEEHAESEDCRAGAQALARVLTWLAG